MIVKCRFVYEGRQLRDGYLDLCSVCSLVLSDVVFSSLNWETESDRYLTAQAYFSGDGLSLPVLWNDDLQRDWSRYVGSKKVVLYSE